MTDKTIINGVDVSRCGFPDKYGYCRCYHTDLGKTPDEFKNIKCKDNPNCHYKQLQREKQKAKEYKQVLKEIKEICILSCDDCNFKNSRICENDECFCNDAKVDEILQKCEVLDE